MIGNTDLDNKTKAEINRYIEMLNGMTESYIKKKYSNVVTNVSFNVLLNGNMGYLANIIFMLASSVGNSQSSHDVLEKIQVMFDDYMIDIKQKLFN